MAENNFKGTMEALFQSMDSVITSKTVLGDAIHVGETIILPLVDVSFGVGAGTFNDDKKNKAGGGLGGKMTPTAVLVIQDGKTKLVNIKNQDTMTKIMDLVPDVIDKVSSVVENKKATKAESVVTEENIQQTESGMINKSFYQKNKMTESDVNEMLDSIN